MLNRPAVTCGLLVAWLVAACSPALNWRQVEFYSLRAVLPCKPDTAQRTVTLAGFAAPMDMVGCEAAGGLYAISRLPVPTANASAPLQLAWQESALANLRVESVSQKAFRSGLVTPNPSGAAPTGSVNLDVVVVAGRSADGRPLQAYLAWFQKDAEIYHVAAIGAQLDADGVSLLFSELNFQ